MLHKYLLFDIKMKSILFSLLFFLIFPCSQAQDSKNIILLDNWTKTGLPQTSDDCTFNEVWGFEHNGKEYAVIGATSGGFLIQISNDQLIEIGQIPSRTTSFMGQIVHRDYKTYRNYLYCVSDESSGLQIVDLNFLPDSINIVYSSSAIIKYAHNIFIDTAKAVLYVCGHPTVNSISYGMTVYTLADPLNPQLLYTHDAVSYVHDAFVRNDTAYLNCGNDGLYVYKFDNGSNPQLLGSLDFYPEQGFNHSGWLSENGKYYVFADESIGKKMKICDVSDLSDIRILDFFNSEGDSMTIAHNLMWKDDFIYVSHYYDGLQIFDARIKDDIKRIAWYDTHTQNSNVFHGAWGVNPFLKDNKVLISDRNLGLYLFKLDLPFTLSAEQEFGVYPNPAIGETMFYYANETELYYTFRIYDAAGKLVYHKTDINSNFLRIDVSSWPAGSYHYHWEGIENTVSLKGKFIVIK